MNDRGRPTDYPPDEIWRFPPPPLSRWWGAAALTISAVATALVLGGLAYVGDSLSRDLPGVIDDEHVVDVVRRECRLMTQTVNGMRVDGRPLERIAALADQDDAVSIMVERIRSLGEAERSADRPLEAWLMDWERLVRAREEHIAALLDGTPTTFTVPQDPSGSPITDRMEHAGRDVCTIPRVLVEPDLAGASSV